MGIGGYVATAGAFVLVNLSFILPGTMGMLLVTWASLRQAAPAIGKASPLMEAEPGT